MILGGIGIVVLSFGATLGVLSYFDPPRARDRQRKADLATLQSALEAYAKANGTYTVKGSGAQGTGQGYVDIEYANSISVANALYKAGYLSKPNIDDPDPGKRPNYMIYLCTPNRYSISATLEQSSESDVAYLKTTCNGVGANGTYSQWGKNYAVGN
jgi:type II secretory pathway pseudopilin PulG